MWAYSILLILSAVSISTQIVIIDTGSRYEPECPDNWYPFPGSSNCYRFYDHIQLSWREAERYCQSHNASMVVIENDAKTHKITRYIEQYGTMSYYSIGLSRKDDSSDWYWSDGRKLDTDSDGVKFDPKPVSGNGLCAKFYRKGTSQGYLQQVVCNGFQSNFICTRDANLPLLCPKDWAHIGENCYKLIDDKRSFVDAREKCKLDHGGDLVVVKRPEIAQFIIDAMYFEKMTSVWLGLQDPGNNNGTFVWINGDQGVDPTDHWGVGEPQPELNSDEFTGNNNKTFGWINGDQGVDRTDYWGVGEPQPELKTHDYTGQYCAQAWISDNAWHSLTCNITTQYVCERKQGGCAYNWQQFGDTCYQFNDGWADWVQWQGGRENCEKQNAQMLQIYRRSCTGCGPYCQFLHATPIFHRCIALNFSKEENDFIYSVLGQWAYFWLGFSNNCDGKQTGGAARNYSWCENGQSIWDYTNFRDKPAYDENTNCGVMLGQGVGDGQWMTEPCDDKLYQSTNYYACQASVGTAVKPLNSKFEDWYCDFGWEQFGKSCYKQIDDSVSWHAAEDNCKTQYGANLISIDSASEQEFADGLASSDFWIGLSRQHSGDWTWTDGTKLGDYQDWGDQSSTTTPASGATADYVVTKLYFHNFGVKFGIWYPAPVTDHYGYMCERLANNVDETPPTGAPWSPECGPYWAYEPISGYCYRVSTTYANWQNAEAACVAYGGHLASIHDQAESSTITAYLAHLGERSIWIGANDLDLQSSWQWSDGTPMNYINWEPNQPDNTGYNEHCVELFGTPENQWFGQWNDLDCAQRRPFMCKKWGTGKTTLTTQFTYPPTQNTGDVFACPSGWDDFGIYCYQLNLSPLSRADSLTDCRAKGGDLVSIHSEHENLLLLALGSSQGSPSTWIGLSDFRTTDLYEWSDGTSVDVTYWNTGEPNGHAGEPCVEFYVSNGYWNDINCEAKLPYFCKKMKAMMSSVRPTIAEGCNEGMVAYESSCYSFVYSKTVERDAASNECKSTGGILVHINNEAEQGFVTAQLAEADVSNSEIWFGLEAFAFSWRWDDDQSSPTYTNWQSENPSFFKGTCAAINTGGDGVGEWISTKCTGGQHPFICEYPRQGYTTVTPPVTTTVPPKVECADETWQRSGQKCIKAFGLYKTNDDQRSWADARSFCQQIHKDGELLSIPDDTANQRMIEIVTRWDGESYWIGLNGLDGKEQWSDGSPVDYTNWGFNQPDDSKPDEKCIITTPSSEGQWFQASCSRQYNWLCQVPIGEMLSTAKPTVPPTLPANCPVKDQAVYSPDSGGKCYWLVDEYLTWDEAKAKCSEGTPNANLATIHTQKEQDAIANLMKKSYSYSNYWIGLSRKTSTDRELQWIDSTAVDYSYWASGEPNDWGLLGESCVEIYKQGSTWNDMHCSTTQPYICEYWLYPKLHTKPTPETPNDGYCLSGWTKGANKCYKVVQDESIQSFNDAKYTCRNMTENVGKNPELASILSWQDQLAIIVNAVDLPQHSFYYIGFSSSGLGYKWAWLDGRPVEFTNWATGEPNSNYGGEECAVMDVSLNEFAGEWFAFSCDSSSTSGFVCQSETEDSSHGTSPIPVHNCATNFSAIGSSCIRVTDNILSWEEAEAQCQTYGEQTHLASITNVYDEAWMRLWMLSPENDFIGKNTDMWIGLNDRKDSQTYEWVDGWPVLYSRWAPGQPNSWDTSKKCVSMAQNDGFWSTDECRLVVKYGFCKYSTKEKPPPPNYCYGDGLICPASTSEVKWLDPGQGGCDCYYTNKGSVSQLEAHRSCIQLEGDLISIHSQSENDWIRDNLLPKLRDPNNPAGISPWIGLLSSYTGGFKWTDGSSFYFDNWAPGEPNSWNTEEDCVEMLNGDSKDVKGMWNDIGGDFKKPYMCQVPKRQGPTSTTMAYTPGTSTVGRQGKNWYYYNENWYYVSPKNWGEDQSRSWRNAKKACEGLSSSLVSLHDINEVDFVVGLVDYLHSDWYTYSIWVGLSELEIDGTYRWTDGSAVNFENWAPGEPNDQGGSSESCVEMFLGTGSNNGLWNDKPCDYQLPFVCKRLNNTAHVTPTPLPDGGCPSGWQSSKIVEKCYKLIGKDQNDRKRWQEAADDCVSMGKTIGKRSRLVSIHNEVEQYWMMAMQTEMMSMNFPFNVWIGLSDQSWYGQFKWSDESIVDYAYWDYGEPGSKTNAYCVHLYYGDRTSYSIGRWQIASCNEAFGYICAVDKDTSIPTALPPIHMNCSGGGYYNHMNGGCYTISTKAEDWSKSETTCPMHLASINDQYEQALISVAMASEGITEGAWIGMSKVVINETGPQEERMKWSDGWPIEYTNWGQNQPSNKDNYNCVSIGSNDDYFTWKDGLCTSQRKAICKQTSAKPPTIPTAFPGVCPVSSDSKYVFRDGGMDNCYQFIYDQQVTFAQAHLACLKEGANLASFHYSEELLFVRDQLHFQGLKSGDLWMGLFKENDGSWQWTDGTSVNLVNWLRQPSTSDSCAAIKHPDGFWYGLDCMTNLGYVCSAKKYLKTTVSSPSTSVTNPFSPRTPMPTENNPMINPLLDMPGLTVTGIALIIITGIMALIVVYLYIQTRKSEAEGTKDDKDTLTRNQENTAFSEERDI